MKKIIIISAIIVALAAVFAVFAVKTDLFKSAETKQDVLEEKNKVKNLNMPAKFPSKIQGNIRFMDKEKFREAVKKIKEKQEKDPDSKSQGGSCGK